MMQMRIREQSDGTIFYAITNNYRIVYGLFCLVIGLGFITVVVDGGFSGASIIPIILFLISFFGLGYRESWKFDPQAKIIDYKVGFLLWVKHTQFSAAEVQSVDITHFVRGRLNTQARPKGRNKAMVIFSLHMHDDSAKDIEIVPERTSYGRTEAAALRIATAMGLDYHADREFDTIQSVSVHDV